MEFCLALPPEQKLHRGLNRMVMRRAMAGIVPEEILRRGDKVDFRPSIKLLVVTVGAEAGRGSDTGQFKSDSSVR